MKVSVLYRYFPHYRLGIIKKMIASKEYDFEFCSSGIPDGTGVKLLDWPLGANFNIGRSFSIGKFYFMPCLFGIHRNKSIDLLIVLGNWRDISLWCIFFLRLLPYIKKKPIALWTHGWINEGGWFLDKIRSLFYKQADLLLLYGEGARVIALKNGLNDESLRVINNSLDFDVQDMFYRSNQHSDLVAYKKSLFNQTARLPVLVVSTRLTKEKNVDFIISAIKSLNETSKKYNLLIIGDGPELPKLKTLACSDPCVVFLGAIYDECLLSKAFMLSDACVFACPVGLAVIHAMTYGTPVILPYMNHYPEVEAIYRSSINLFYEPNNIHSFEAALAQLTSEDKTAMQEEMREIIRKYYSPSAQMSSIERSIAGLI